MQVLSEILDKTEQSGRRAAEADQTRPDASFS
jgi:hypothetical protein